MPSKTLLTLSVFLSSAIAAQAEITEIAGLFYPSIDEGRFTWSCQEQDVGMEGGALKISTTEYHGVENRCSVNDPSPAGTGYDITLECMSEGMPYQERIHVEPTETGVEITNEYGVIQWTRCSN